MGYTIWPDGTRTETPSPDTSKLAMLKQQREILRDLCAPDAVLRAVDEAIADAEAAEPPRGAETAQRDETDESLETIKFDARTRAVMAAVYAAPAGVVGGILYCYGGCGRRYANDDEWPSDVHVPTPIWNQIAVGAPFDETQENIDREGRGGVLCLHCMWKRLAALPGVSSVTLSTDAEAGAASLPATRPTPQDVQRKFERSQQRWGNLKARIEAEIVSLENPCLSTQQRNQYANGVARLRWVLREMWKSPDVLAEVAEVIQQLRCPHCGTSNYQPNERCVNHGELEHQHSGRGSTSQHRQPEGREQDGGGVRAAVEGRGAHDRGGDVHARREGIDHAEGAEAHSKVEASLPATRPTPEPLEHIINGWREIGEEVERIVLFMTQAQRDDLLPDWFEPRLTLMLSKRAASLPQGEGLAWLTLDLLRDALEAGNYPSWPPDDAVERVRAVLAAAAQTKETER